ncbi:MAG: NUDIX domain-containing protein [Patescibacteria group bacterium]
MKVTTRVVAVIIQDHKLLLEKGKGYNELWVPGGKIEPHESELDCLKRELAEELNIELVSANFFKKYLSKHFYDHNRLTKDRVYLTTVNGAPQPQNEIESVVWFTKEDLASKKYQLITNTEENLIPDLIQAGLL